MMKVYIHLVQVNHSGIHHCLFLYSISNQPQHMESLLGIMMGKVELADMEVNSVIEMLIHVLSTIVIQLETMPPT